MRRNPFILTPRLAGVLRLLSCFFQFTYDSLIPWKLPGFSSVQHKNKRPRLRNRPPNINKHLSTVFFKLVEQHARFPRCLSAEQLLRAGLFLKNPDRLVAVNEPNLSLDWVRWRFHDPPNLESQYQRLLISCQEKNAKSGIFFS